MLLRQLPVSMLKRPKNWKYGPHSTGKQVNEFILVQFPMWYFGTKLIVTSTESFENTLSVFT